MSLSTKVIFAISILLPLGCDKKPCPPINLAIGAHGGRYVREKDSIELTLLPPSKVCYKGREVSTGELYTVMIEGSRLMLRIPGSTSFKDLYSCVRVLQSSGPMNPDSGFIARNIAGDEIVYPYKFPHAGRCHECPWYDIMNYIPNSTDLVTSQTPFETNALPGYAAIGVGIDKTNYWCQGVEVDRHRLLQFILNSRSKTQVLAIFIVPYDVNFQRLVDVLDVCAEAKLESYMVMPGRQKKEKVKGSVRSIDKLP